MFYGGAIMRLKEARKSAGLTQKEVATVVGVNQNTYSYWENGKTKIDSESLAKLSELFGVTTDFLLDKAPCKTTVDSVNDKPAVMSGIWERIHLIACPKQSAATAIPTRALTILSLSPTLFLPLFQKKPFWQRRRRCF